MMVSNPEQWINDMADAQVDQYTFHVEPVENVAAVCRKVKEAGMKVGLAIKPKTSVESIEQYMELADLVLIMTVEPGFGGQKFMEDMMSKVKYLRSNYATMNIEVDGGVSTSNIDCCAKAGANWIVSGTGIIKAPDQRAVIKELRDSVSHAIVEYSK